MARIKSVSGHGYGSSYLDSIIWGGSVWDMRAGPLKAWLGEKGEVAAGEADNVHGPSWGEGEYNPATGRYEIPYVIEGATLGTWYEDEAQPVLYAMNLYASVCGIKFSDQDSDPANDPQDITQADIVWWKTVLPGSTLGIHEGPRETQTWGYFNGWADDSWNNLKPGGLGQYTIIHEIGHGLGLAHPHDGGGEDDATRFPGVDDSGGTGHHGLNQAVYTVMSYNFFLNGEETDGSYGLQMGLGAFDIAALQKLYGANNSTATGNDTYQLPTQNAVGTGWLSIWDAGGTDTMSAAYSHASVKIDLRAATLVENDPNAGGILSRQQGIKGGFTIANGVVIENAIGGSSSDVLVGNSANNVLNGGGGADTMSGGVGDDTYYVDNAGDVINDTSGTNTIIATTSYTLNGVVVTGSGTVDNEAIIIRGGSTADNVIGNAKDNKLYGGLGKDMLTGGAGKDFFVFNTKLNKKTNVDVITDYSVADDTIWLDNKYFKKLGSKGSEANPKLLNKKFFTIGTKAKDKDDYLVYNKKTGVLYYDKDGSGSAKAEEFVKLAKNLKLTYKDFFVV